MRRFLWAAVWAAAVTAAVTACSPTPPPAAPAAAAAPVAAQPAAPVPPVVPTTTHSAAPATKTKAKATSSTTDRCTNRIDYSSDPRDNATINSIGATTGKCPTPIRAPHKVGSGYDPTDPSYQGADDPGTRAGRGPTSGELQTQWGCQQGYIPASEC